jgi:two-component system, chemotaxis family, protein-glutamate methylesterase/glutaminase
VIAQHLPPHDRHVSQLAEILARRTELNVRWARVRDLPVSGTALVAPADRHVSVRPDGRLDLIDSAPLLYARPAVDILFESAARVHGSRTISIVLSGRMWDGARGTTAVRDVSGLTIAESDASAKQFEMPSAAIDVGRADIILPALGIAELLQRVSAAQEEGGDASED